MDMKAALDEAADREYPRQSEDATNADQYLRLAERAAFANGFAAGVPVGIDAATESLGMGVAV